MIYESRKNLRHNWENTHPFLRFLILISAAAFVFLFILPPGYRLAKSLMPEKKITAADAALKEKELLTARDLSLTGIHSSKSSIQAYQILLHQLSAEDPKILGLPWKSMLPSERKKFSDWIKQAGESQDEQN